MARGRHACNHVNVPHYRGHVATLMDAKNAKAVIPVTSRDNVFAIRGRHKQVGVEIEAGGKG